MKTLNRILSMLLVISMVMSIAVTGIVAEEATTEDTTEDNTLTGDHFLALITDRGEATEITLTAGATYNFDGFDSYPIEIPASLTINGNGATLINVNVEDKGLFDLSLCVDANSAATFKNLNIGTDTAYATASGRAVEKDAEGNVTQNATGAALIFQTNDAYTKCYTNWENVNVYANLTVKAEKDTGVFFGRIAGDHHFENCNVTVLQSGSKANAFGVYIGRSNGGNKTFENCTANGTIDNAKNVGGFIGKVNKASFTNCTNNATLYSTGGNGNMAGGFVGAGESGTIPAFANCINNGTVGVANIDVVFGHFYGQATVQDSVTEQWSIPSNQTDILIGEDTWTVIHSKDDFSKTYKVTYEESTDSETGEEEQKEVKTAIPDGKYILSKTLNFADAEGNATAAFENNEIMLGAGSIFDGNGFSFLNFYTENGANESTKHTSSTPKGRDGIFSIPKGEVTIQNLTFGADGNPVRISNAIITRGMNGGTADAPQNTNLINVDAYVELTRYSGGSPAVFFSFIENGTHTFTDCDVDVKYIQETVPGSTNGTPWAVAGFIGRVVDGNATPKPVNVTFTNCTSTVDFTLLAAAGVDASGLSPANVGAAFIGEVENTHDGTSVTFKSATASGTITGENVPRGAFVGSVENSASVTGMLSECTNNTNVPTITVYTNQTYEATDANGNVTERYMIIDSEKYYELLDFNSLVASRKYVLLEDFTLGTIDAPFEIPDGIVLEGNNHVLTVDLSATKFLFTFTKGTTATFKNFTIGSENEPIQTPYGVIAMAAWESDQTPTDNNPTPDPTYSYGAFDTNWEGVKIYAKLEDKSANQGVFFGGNLEGNHTFTSCAVTIKLIYNAEGVAQTKQGNAVGAYIGRAASGTAKFDSCYAYGSIIAVNNAGGFIGKNNAAVTFEGCENEASVTATTGTTNFGAGGFIGRNEGTVTFTNNCVNSGTITGTKTAGGFVGDTIQPVTVDASINSGLITATNNLGGFIGLTSTSFAISNSTNRGNISPSNSGAYAGGFVGATGANFEATFTNDKNYGNVSGFRAAGLVGQYYGGTLTVTNCENHGAISAGNQGAGLVANANTSTVLTITNSLNAGDVTSPSWAAGIAYKGGTIKIENCVNLAAITAINNKGAYVDTYISQILAYAVTSAEITNTYAFGTVNESKTKCMFISNYSETKQPTLAGCRYIYVADEIKDIEGATPVPEYMKDDLANGLLGSVVMLYQLSNEATEYRPYPDHDPDFVADVYSVRLIAGLNSADYKKVEMEITMTIGDWTDNGMTYEIKTLYKQLWAAEDDTKVAVDANTYGCEYFAAVAIDLLPVGTDATFEISLIVTDENGNSYTIVDTKSVTTNGPENTTNTPAN